MSQRPNLPSWSFSHSGGPSLEHQKYPKDHIEVALFPGPGAYGNVGSGCVGHQYESKRSNTAKFSFGTGIRDPFSPLRSADQSVAGAANMIKPIKKGGAGPGEYGSGPSSIGFQTLSHRGTLSSYTFGSTSTRLKRRNRFKQDRVVHFGEDSPGPCQYDGRIAAFGRSILTNKRQAASAKFGTAGKFRGGSFKKPSTNRRAMTPGPGKYMLMSAIGPQTESQRPSTASARFSKQIKIVGPGSFFNTGSADMPGPGKYGMIPHGPGSPRSPRFGFGSTRKFGHKRVIMRDNVISPRQQEMAMAIRKSMKRN